MGSHARCECHVRLPSGRAHRALLHVLHAARLVSGKPTWAIVGEVSGAEGESRSKPEYKTGLRWEPNPYANLALTYGQEFNGTAGAGVEFGIMLFTPPFMKL